MSLDKIIFDMQKVFGKESVGAAIDIVQDKGHYSTGSLQLNAKLSGGFPKGLMTEIYGPEGSGKTTACLHAVADAQSKGHGAVYVDFEGSFDKIYGKGLGIDLKKLILIPPTNAEQGLQIAEKLCKSGEIGILVVDSIATMLPIKQQQAELGDANMALHARLVSDFVKRFVPIMYTNNVAVVLVNQIREKPGVTFGCLQADTLINTEEGSISIREIVDNKIRTRVWCYNETTNKFELKPIINWFNNGNVKDNSEFLSILTTSIDGKGRFGATVTPDHKVRTINGWLEAKNLKVGDKLLSKYFSYDSDTLRAFLLGDVSIQSKYNIGRIVFTDTENPKYLNWKLKILEKLNFKTYGEVSCSEHSYEFAKFKKEGIIRNPLALFPEELPDFALAVWMMDDGHYDSKNSHNRYVLSMKRYKNNTKILDKIGELFTKKGLSFGIDYKTGRFFFHTSSTSIISEIMSKYAPEDGCMDYKIPYKHDSRETIEPLTQTVKEDYVEVVGISVASDRKLRQKSKYDIQVEDNSNYLAGGYKNGFLVHNSPEYSPGGNSIKFYAAVRLDIRKSGSVNKDKDGEVISEPRKIKIVKSKINSSTHDTMMVDITYGEGFDRAGEIVDVGSELGLLEKSGSWYAYNNTKIAQGRESCKQFLKDNPELAKELEDKIIDKLFVKIISEDE